MTAVLELDGLVPELDDPRSGLETYGETVATREGRYAARTILGPRSHRETVRKCGRVPVQDGSAIRLRVTSDEGRVVSAGWSGLATCGSPWVCPVCSAKIAAHRMADLTAGVTSWTGRGGRLAMLTLTLRHRKGQKLADLWDSVSRAWRRLVRSGSYRRLVTGMGVAGYVRATEVTYGRHGWHVHFHVLYFLRDTGIMAELLASDRARLVDLWVNAVGAEGRTARVEGQDFRLFLGDGEALRAGAEYLVKSTYTDRGVGAEVAGGAYKLARQGGDTPFGIGARLVEAQETGGEPSMDDEALWREWDRASAGRRAVVWSRGLRAELGLDVELTDEEAAALELDGDDVLEVSGDDARRLLRSGRLCAWVLSAAEQGETVDDARARAADVLAGHGIAWEYRDASAPGWGRRRPAVG